MAQSKNTTNFEGLLFQFMDSPDPMLSMLEWLCSRMMEAEVSSKIGADKHEQSQERTSHRCGFRPRRLDTRVGTMYLMVPKVRSGGYIPFFVTERKRSEAALIQVIQEAYVQGVSTRKIEKLAKSLGIEGISRSQVSEMTQGLNEQAEEFRNRPLTSNAYPVLWVDALYEKVRYAGRVVSMAILLVCGVSEEGKPNRKKVRKALRKQLGYVKRDLGYLGTILATNPDVLSAKQLEYLAVIRKLYEQQQEMYENNTHRVDDRIVSLHQPWVRPIVRGKTAVPVEFGAKVALSMSEGYARVEEISWDAFNEGKTLIESMERHKERTGHYPDRGLVDRIYRTRENPAWCKERGIRLNGPKLGRPPRDKQAYLESLELERLESGERNEIEGCIGVCKRRYGLDLVLMRLKHTSEVDIHVSILTRNLFKRLKSLFCLVLDWVRRSGWGRKTEDSVLLNCLAA